MQALQVAPETGMTSLPEAFQPPIDKSPSVEHLFTGAPQLIIQGPEIRNDYKKKSGSSDAAKTYDTTSI
ncbi:hypothetical protein ACQP1W_01385 [Spirillospora sp. CA-255316]